MNYTDQFGRSLVSLPGRGDYLWYNICTQKLTVYTSGQSIGAALRCFFVHCLQCSLLYCGTMAFAAGFNAYADEEYVWLSDGDTQIRVDKDEYEKYMKKSDPVAPQDKAESETIQNNDNTENTIESETEAETEPTTEDLSETPR